MSLLQLCRIGVNLDIVSAALNRVCPDSAQSD
jgi:hypothetical protein